jgi:hypothetical protein
MALACSDRFRLEANVPGTAEWMPHKVKGEADALDSARKGALPKGGTDRLPISWLHQSLRCPDLRLPE